MKKFEITCTGHETKARRLLLEEALKTEKELALMTSNEVEDVINANFECYKCGDDWLLVPKDKVYEFNRIVTWIER